MWCDAVWWCDVMRCGVTWCGVMWHGFYVVWCFISHFLSYWVGSGTGVLFSSFPFFSCVLCYILFPCRVALTLLCVVLSFMWFYLLVYLAILSVVLIQWFSEFRKQLWASLSTQRQLSQFVERIFHQVSLPPTPFSPSPSLFLPLSLLFVYPTCHSQIPRSFPPVFSSFLPSIWSTYRCFITSRQTTRWRRKEDLFIYWRYDFCGYCVVVCFKWFGNSFTLVQTTGPLERSIHLAKVEIKRIVKEEMVRLVRILSSCVRACVRACVCNVVCV